jgi:Zn-dependent M28 family amino/carboxypeptidase
LNGDTIFNGANDDASGTTAVIALAEYFAKMKKAGKDLGICSFHSRRVGGYGSFLFFKALDPAKVMAMFNIEMIGTDSKWARTVHISQATKEPILALYCRKI